MAAEAPPALCYKVLLHSTELLCNGLREKGWSCQATTRRISIMSSQKGSLLS